MTHSSLKPLGFYKKTHFDYTHAEVPLSCKWERVKERASFMLQKLNERLQGAIAWIVISVIVFTFALFGVDYYRQSHQGYNAVAEVNGTPVMKQAFEINYQRARQQNDLSQMTASNERALRKQVLEGMIENEVTLQAAKADGFEVSPLQANAAIVRIPQFQQDGRFSEARYQQALSSAMFTPESFQREVRQGMLLNQQRFTFIGSAFALPREISQFVKLSLQTRDYDYLLIPRSLFVKPGSVSDKKITEYYRSHQKEFRAPEQVSLDFIRLSMQSIKNQVHVSDDEIKRYYNENQANFQKPAQWQVAHVLFAFPSQSTPEAEKQLKEKAEKAALLFQHDPAQFSIWVKTVSDDKLSAAHEGVLPWLTAGQNEFDKELINLTQPGQISPVVKTSRGYEIFKLLAYKPSNLMLFSQASEIIREQLRSELAQTHYTQALEQLGDLSYQTPDSLLAVADALKQPIEHTEAFSREGGTGLLSKSKQIVNTAFSHDVLDLANNSEPVQLDNDSVVVFRVNQHLLAVDLPLAQVRDRIIQQLATKEAELKAEELGGFILSGKKDSIDSNSLVWREVKQATRDKIEKINPEINELAFNLTTRLHQSGHRLMNGDYVVVRLKNVRNGQLKQIDHEQQESLTQQIAASYGMTDYKLYLKHLIATSKIRQY